MLDEGCRFVTHHQFSRHCLLNLKDKNGKDMPIIPIYYYVSPRLVKPYLEGLSKDPLDNFYFKDMSFKK